MTKILNCHSTLGCTLWCNLNNTFGVAAFSYDLIIRITNLKYALQINDKFFLLTATTMIQKL